MIHVCFGLHDGDGHYSKFVGTTMASIFDNTTAEVTIHILHDDTLTDSNREKFLLLAARHNRRVEFHNVDELCADDIAYLRDKLADKIRSRFSIGAFYRLLVKKLFGAGKMIYLDADIVVNMDIAELWRVDLQNFPIAAVPEIKATNDGMFTDKVLLNTGVVRAEDYFCSGVMVFAVERLDENLFVDGVNFLADNPKCESVDQDSLNALFSKNYLKLEGKFDSFVYTETPPVATKIYHYAGHTFGLDSGNVFDRLWLEYFSQTPWLNVDVLYNFGAEFRNVTDEFVRQMQWLMTFVNDKRRAFFAVEKNFAAIKALFGSRKDDRFLKLKRNDLELIPANFDTLVKEMHAQLGRTIFFVFDLNYDFIRLELLARGFVEYRDFVNGLLFLTRGQGGQTYPEHNFVRAL